MTLLLLPERELIDCIKDKNQIDINELSEMMLFNKKFIFKVIEKLKEKKIIKVDYFNKLDVNFNELEKINSNRSVMEEEVSDIFNDLIKAYFSKKEFVSDFTLEGVWINSFEEKLLQCKKAELTSLISSFRSNRPKAGYSKKLISYTSCDYSSLSRFSLDNLLN